MPTKFALPIMHITSGNYLPFAGKFLQGRMFYQPIDSLLVKDLYPTGGPPDVAAHLNDPISKYHAPGIEMFFDGVDAEVSKIFCMFDGFITWIGDRLILTPEPKALQQLSATKMPEAGLGRVIYENIEKASMKTALMDLILTSYPAANNHPILKCAILPGLGPVMTTFNKLLFVTPPADREAIIEPIVDSFLAGGQTFQMKAGELLGKADSFKATDDLPDAASRPAWFKTIADADRARKILVVTKDVGKQVLNPWYYLHNYASSQTPITISPALHPLLQGTAPTYGRHIMGTTYYFPLGDLNTLHGVPSDDSDSTKFFKTRSSNKWRYDDDGLFEANEYDKAGVATAFAIPDGAAAQKKFKKLRIAYLALLNDYCEKLQIPVALMFGIFGAETKGDSTADVRLEPLKASNEAELSSVSALIHKYNKLTGFHCQASHVLKEGDDFKFLVEKSELIKGIFPNTTLNVAVPMRLYYDKDKYWRLKTIDIKKKDVFKTGFKGKQGFGKTVFYPINKVTAGKPNLADVEIAMTKSSYLQLDMRSKDKLFKKKPTLNGDTTITIWVNGVESDLSFTMGKGDRKINDPKILEQAIVVSPADKVGMSVETDGTAGEIEGLDVRFKLTSIWVTVPKAYNRTRATFAEITHVVAGMAAGGSMASATTNYFPIGSLAAGVSDRKTVAAFKAPGDGLLLISELNVDSNILKKAAQVNILRKKVDAFTPTGITGTIAAGAKKIIKIPFSEMVKKDEEFILEITTPAAASKAVPEQLGRVTMNVYFVPFNNDESFLTSKHGYSFDLSKLNRAVTTDPVKTENGRTMTWDELYEVIRKTKGARISIGPAQTLISTAMDTVRQQATNINRLIAPLSLADPALFIDYLLDPAKSLAIGAALIRSHYNFSPDLKTGQNLSTQFDIPLASSVHNASRHRRNFVFANGGWGLKFAAADSYIRNAASMFNVAQEKTKIDFIPTVQFKK